MAQDPITLKVAGWEAAVSPSIGGALLSLAYEGQAILRAATEEVVGLKGVRLTAGYPLIPYANRIADGRFSFGGRDYQLEPHNPHSLHGVGWRRSWTVRDQDEQACTLSLLHRPETDGAKDWPFAFAAEQRFVLSERGLALSLSVTNLEPTAAPAGLGWHPFFHRRPGERLTFRAEAAWRNGPSLLPTDVETAPGWNHAGGQALDDRAWDNDFSGWDGVAALDAPAGLAVRLRADPVFGGLRLYTPPGREFYAVEPVTHLANAINRPELKDHAMTLLAPGASLRGDIDISLESRS